MAKTRMMKPDIRTSVKVASWPREVRYFWTLLWGYVDDYGKGLDNALLVKADCFPLDEDVTAATIDCWLWRLEQDGVLARYTAAGKDVLAVVHWSEHQKPQHPKASDLPDATGAVRRSMHEPCMNPSCITHPSFTPELSRDELSRGDAARSAQSPFCVVHPTGTSESCRSCADARRAYDAASKAEKTRPTPIPPRLTHCEEFGHDGPADGRCVRCGEWVTPEAVAS